MWLLKLMIDMRLFKIIFANTEVNNIGYFHKFYFYNNNKMRILVAPGSDPIFFNGSLFFLFRVNKMVDIVTNRVFETFSRFSPQQNHQTDGLSTISSLKRFARDQQFQRKNNFREDAKVCELIQLIY